MSWIDSSNTEECITNASMKNIERTLVKRKYKVTRTNLQITATYGGTFKTNGKISTITVVDCGNYRQCKDVETAKGWLCRPKSGVLAEIVKEAEALKQEG